MVSISQHITTICCDLLKKMTASWLLLIYYVILLHGTSIVRMIDATGILDIYHQDDYDVKYDRIEVVWYNPSYFSHLKAAFVFYNRTQRAVNGTANLLQDLPGELTVNVECFKFLSNEYRYFPMQFSFDLCEKYESNTFGMKDALKDTSNFHGCPFAKGPYYIRNGVADASKFPPYVPKGAYKAVVKGYHKSTLAFEAHGYAAVEDKPTKWKV